MSTDMHEKTTRKTPTKAEYKTERFIESLLEDAATALHDTPRPRIGKYGNSKIKAAGTKALTLVYSGLAWHDCNPTPGCEGCYAMRFRYLHAAAHRRGTAWLYSYMARETPGALETIIRDEINEALARARRLGLPLAVRIHEAGDYINPRHVAMWHSVTRAYPDVQFWGYTRSDLISDDMARAITELSNASNVHLRASFDPTPDTDKLKCHILHLEQTTRNGLPGALIIGRVHRGVTHGPGRVAGAVNCPEQLTGGAIGCADCGLCWSKARPVIRFYRH